MTSHFQDMNWRRPRTISVVVDTPGWFDPHAECLVKRAAADGDRIAFVRKHADIPSGDIAFYLSCQRITPPEILARNTLNVVVHASDLPRGRGFSPLPWQILEGRNAIPLTMIEAVDAVDAGGIIMRDSVTYQGHELNGELRDRMGLTIVEMCLKLLRLPVPPVLEEQDGEPTWYRRRRPVDSRLDPQQPLAGQFDLLRIVDNERYPAFFDYRGHRYALKIEDVGPVSELEKGTNNEN